jgi:hypothetical protein
MVDAMAHISQLEAHAACSVLRITFARDIIISKLVKILHQSHLGDRRAP